MSKILGKELSNEVVELLNKELTTVILATITDEGFPHSMPVHLVIASNNKTLKMAIVRGHKTSENIRKNNRAVITVIDGPDIAISIKGSAKIAKEYMECNPDMCIAEFIVDEVKSDATPTVIITEGIRGKHRDDSIKGFFRMVFDELKG